MTDSNKFEELFKSFIEIQPLLPGSVSEQYSVCGKPECPCKDESNPRRHGPYHQLSYTLSGRSSSLFIKSAEVSDTRRMNESYKKVRSLLGQLSEESLSLCREYGVSEARRQMSEAISRVKSSLGTSKRAEKPPLYLLRSRDNWKQKALQRHARLEKNRIRIRDLEQSRQKWRNEALRLRHENRELRQKLAAVEEEKAELNDSLQVVEDDKKNA